MKEYCHDESQDDEDSGQEGWRKEEAGQGHESLELEHEEVAGQESRREKSEANLSAQRGGTVSACRLAPAPPREHVLRRCGRMAMSVANFLCQSGPLTRFPIAHPADRSEASSRST